MKNNLHKLSVIFIFVFFLGFTLLYYFGGSLFPVSCDQITEPFRVIPKQTASQDEFRSWVAKQYQQRKNDKITIAANSPRSNTYGIRWENGDEVYVANFKNDPAMSLVFLEIYYSYQDGMPPHLDDVIFRNSRQRQLDKVIDCFGAPKYYVATIDEHLKSRIIRLWYPEKGMIVYSSTRNENAQLEKLDVDSILFFTEPTLTNMQAILEQLDLTNYYGDAKSMQTWTGIDKINFINSPP